MGRRNAPAMGVPIASLDEYRERRNLERLLRASLGQCGNCGRQVMEHKASERMACWTALTFGTKEPA